MDVVGEDIFSHTRLLIVLALPLPHILVALPTRTTATPIVIMIAIHVLSLGLLAQLV